MTMTSTPSRLALPRRWWREGSRRLRSRSAPQSRPGIRSRFRIPTLETGSAKAADGDFTAASNVLLSFGARRAVRKDATVTTLNDTVVENQETFPVQLSNATSSTGSAAITGATANGTINDNDQYSISIAAAPAVVEGA